MAQARTDRHGNGKTDGFMPLSLSDDERLDEIAGLLALGIFRLRARQRENSPVRSGSEAGFGLDFTAEQSVCGSGPENGPEELCK